MEAIREFAQLEDNLLTMRLPASFKAKRVEVIVIPAEEQEPTDEQHSAFVRRKPSPKLKGTRIVGDIMSPVVPLEEWESLK